MLQHQFVYVEHPPRCSQLSNGPHWRWARKLKRDGKSVGKSLKISFTVPGQEKAKHFRFRLAHARSDRFALSTCNCVALFEGHFYLFRLQWRLLNEYRRFMNEKFLISLRPHQEVDRWITSKFVRHFSSMLPTPPQSGNNKKENHFHSRKNFAMCMASETKKNSSSKNNISVARSLSLASVVLAIDEREKLGKF